MRCGLLKGSQGERAKDERGKGSEVVQENEKILELLKKQLFFTRVFAAACCILTAAVLIVLILVIPSLLGIMDQAVAAMDQASATLQTANDTLTDIHGLFEEDGLVGQSGQALEQATEKIGRMDIDSLNRAIRELGDVVEPLADFFDKFR